MNLLLVAVLCLAVFAVPIDSENARLKEVFAWKFVDYAWGKPEDRDAAIASGEFVPENNLPLGLEVWKDKLFITVPRWKNGVVATLNYVKITDDDDDTTTPLPPEPTEDPDTPEPEDETETPDEPATDATTPPPPPTDPTTPPPPTDPTTPPPPTDPTTPPPPTDPTTPPPPTDPTTPPPPTDPTTPPPPTDPTTPPPPTDPTTPPPPTDPTTPPPPTDPTTPPPPTDPTTPPPPTDPTTPPPPTDPTTPPPPTDPTTEDSTPTEDEEDPTPQPTASILPMPARRIRRAPGEDEELRNGVLVRKSSGKTRREKKKEVDEDEDEEKKKKRKKEVKEDEDEEKKKKRKKELKEDEDEEKKKKKKKEMNEDEDEEKEKKKKKKKETDEDEDKDKKKKKDKDRKDKDKDKEKKKKKKKCKPKPKPTTPAPPTTAEATETTDATTGTETTAPPPPPPRSPALIPYPSFAANRVVLDAKEKADEPAPIVSVFRVWADACDRLWVMDTGVADILGKTAVVSKPRILIYNLNNDELMKTYEFKDSDSEEHSFFANIIVDADPENCDKAFAYVPDLGGYGIVSYDFANDKSRRLKHNYFHFDPLAGNMEVGGVNFQWTDGVFSIALSKPMDDGFRTAYFHCLASTKEFSVSTKVLKGGDSSESSYYDYKLVGDRGEKSQSSASYIHEDTGIMFYTQLQKDSVNCWNTNKPLTADNLVEVASDNETMIFTNDLKVDRDGNLWVLTDKLPVFIYRGLDDSEVNYRIFTATVDEAVAGTNCAP